MQNMTKMLQLFLHLTTQLNEIKKHISIYCFHFVLLLPLKLNCSICFGFVIPFLFLFFLFLFARLCFKSFQKFLIIKSQIKTEVTLEKFIVVFHVIKAIQMLKMEIRAKRKKFVFMYYNTKEFGPIVTFHEFPFNFECFAKIRRVHMK